MLVTELDKTIDLKEQITEQQYRLGYDANGNFAIYTVRGLQLAWNGGGHYYAHTALDNTRKHWYFADSIQCNTNPKVNKYKINMFGASNKSLHSSKGNSSVQTFMYRKMTRNEVLNYINN